MDSAYEMPDPYELLNTDENRKEYERIVTRYGKRPKPLNRELKKFIKRITEEWRQRRLKENLAKIAEELSDDEDPQTPQLQAGTSQY